MSRAVTDYSTADARRDAALEIINNAPEFHIPTLASLDLSGCDFTGLDFKGARLVGCNCTDAKFDGANLYDIMGTNGVNFTRASFVGTDLRNARCPGADLSGAIFTNAKLGGVVFYAQSMIPTISPETTVSSMTRDGRVVTLKGADAAGALGVGSYFNMNFRDVQPTPVRAGNGERFREMVRLNGEFARNNQTCSLV